MKLLILTQVIDTEHPILGFFHRWVEVFAENCEEVQVVCLQAGAHDLPKNVHVHSLGKETGKGRLTYFFRFYRLIWQLRHEYDGVYVHMNQEYVLLGALLWKLLGKRVSMWRNHFAGSLLTSLAGFLSDVVFYTSDASYTARFKNALQMPIGIDFDMFKPQVVERKKDSLLYVGRISKSKRIEKLLEAFKQAYENKPSLTLRIVGEATEGAEEYEESLKAYAKNYQLPVTFVGSVSWHDLPAVYSAHELCINVSPPGMFDKVIGEALACNCDIVTSNPDSKAFRIHTIENEGLTTSLASFLASYQYDQNHVRNAKENIQSAHSLTSLVSQVLQKIQS